MRTLTEWVAQSPDTFLKPAEGDTLPEPFVIENHYDEIEAALQYDDRLAEQLETLVPKQYAPLFDYRSSDDV